MYLYNVVLVYIIISSVCHAPGFILFEGCGREGSAHGQEGVAAVVHTGSRVRPPQAPPEAEPPAGAKSFARLYPQTTAKTSGLGRVGRSGGAKPSPRGRPPGWL